MLPWIDADDLSWRRQHMALLRDEEVSINQSIRKRKKKDPGEERTAQRGSEYRSLFQRAGFQHVIGRCGLSGSNECGGGEGAS